MSAGGRKDRNSAIQEISQKIRLSLSIIVFVIFTLFAVILRYLYEPSSAYLDFLPDISVTLIIGISFFLTVIGLYLAIRMSRQVLRIAADDGNRLENLLDMTRDLREEVHGDILLQKVLDNAMQLTRSEAGSILLAEEGKLAFRIVRGGRASHLMGKTIEEGKGIAGWTAREARPVRLADASKDERFDAEIDSATEVGTKSLMSVPLKTRDEVVGVIELVNREKGHPYRERDEEIISYLAQQAAISVVKAKLYDDQRNYEIHLTGILLDALDYHSIEKRGHARRVARYGNLIAKSIGMSEEQQKRLHFASLLHDVGFLKINPDDVFRKEEYLCHPVIGYEMVQPINFYSALAPFILHHHERYDGYGYPAGLQGGQIPLESRIIAIAEAFDAMVSENTYKVRVSFEEALEELQRRGGTQFDPRLAEIFVTEMKPQFIVL